MYNSVLLMDGRQLIPRWHTSRKSMALQFPGLPKSKISKAPEPVDDPWLEEARKTWRHENDILSATELNVALLLNNALEDDDYLSTLNFLLSKYSELPAGVAELINPSDLEGGTSYYSTNAEVVRNNIKSIRKRLKNQPCDSVSWVDLAFYYTVIGQDEKALKCLKTGWGICRNHPFVSRAYARYLVHKEKPDEAVWVLKNSGSIKENPLIASAHIAISNSFELPGQRVNDGRKLLKSYSGEPAFLSDLAACLATIEFQNGSVKKAKKMFGKALAVPSENALSQYGWLKQKYGFFLDESALSSMTSIENDANELYVKGAFENCRAKLIELHRFQPFTDAPLVDAGYMSMLGLNDPDFVVELSEKRVQRTHMSFGELNNLVVAKLMKGDFSSIETDMRLLGRKAESKEESAKGVFLATSGMFMFKAGDVGRGVELYDRAISYFKYRKMERSVALAEHFLSQNIKGLGLDRYYKLRKSVCSASEKHKMKELLVEWE